LIIAGLRKLTDAVKKGRAEGQMELLSGQIEHCFGPIPPRIRKRLDSLKPAQVKAASLRLLKAERIEDLFPRSQVKPS